MLALMLMLSQASSPASIPPSEEQIVSPADQQLLQQSASIGTILYALDKAARVSTDALLEKMDRAQLAGPGGYVIERASGSALRATYFRGVGKDARAFFVAEVEGEELLRSELLPAPVPLTARQAELAAAREAAAKIAVAEGYKPCSAAPFNTVVVPSSDGPIGVYLLTAQTTAASYPIGGHFRVVVGPDGEKWSSRPFSASCLNLDLPKLPTGSEPVALVTSNRLDPVPTEIFVFASHSLGLPLYVATNDQRLWQVDGRKIELRPDKIN
ncbi:hypothetical protein [Sphingopyxis sp.]|uniref:hypothetical protein n=1 Tax=Sphingopyxis sp. TaxID=1908224 RepID=UPI003D0DB39E